MKTFVWLLILANFAGNAFGYNPVVDGALADIDVLVVDEADAPVPEAGDHPNTG